MNKEMFLKAAIACEEVYKNNHDLGTTEFNVSVKMINRKPVQVLAIAGTNEKSDWVENINLLSKRGIKLSAYNAAFEIIRYCKVNSLIDSRFPILVTGHSKAGPTAIAYHRLMKIYNPAFSSAWCVVFAPARSLRYWTSRKMDGTYVFIDPDDPVSFVGRLSFGHPECVHYKAENNHFGFKVSDHDIRNWVRFCKNMQ